jgi:hypothetical protein
MFPNEFARQTAQFWFAYFEKIKAHADAGNLESSAGSKTYYPNLLICTETPDIFLAELIGIQNDYRGLTLKRRRQDSAELYVNQLPLPAGRSVIQFSGEGNLFRSLCLGHNVDRSALLERFPVVDLFPTSLVMEEQLDTGSAIQFGDGFVSAQIDNCVVINRLKSIFRAKHILSLTMVSRDLSPARYRQFLTDMVAGTRVSAVHTVSPEKGKDYAVTGQFQNLYLAPNLHETTIGEFLNRHPDILLRAFSARRCVYEPHLKWIERGGAMTETAINPDLLLERDGGSCDIYDLKTAALTKVSLTKGARNRRRFIDYVEEGIAQLANYEEYFSFPKNRLYAKERYQVMVENPQLRLVVGNFDNANQDEIIEASRKLRNITVIDYDTLTQLFLAAPPR